MGLQIDGFPFPLIMDKESPLLLVVWSLSHVQLFCDPMDCSPPGTSVHGISQASILGWVAISFSKGSSWPGDWTWISCIAGRFFTKWVTREAAKGLQLNLNGAQWLLREKSMKGNCAVCRLVITPNSRIVSDLSCQEACCWLCWVPHKLMRAGLKGDNNHWVFGAENATLIHMFQKCPFVYMFGEESADEDQFHIDFKFFNWPRALFIK